MTIRALMHAGGNDGDMLIMVNGVWVPLAIPADWASVPYALNILDGKPAWVPSGTATDTQVLSLSTIASTAALFAPTVVSGEPMLQPPAIASGSALFAPTVAAAVGPADIADLFSWQKSDAGVFSDAGTTPAIADDPVQQWNDQSGNGNHMSQPTLAQRPLYKANVINSLPALRFDASFDWIANGTLNRPLTVFVVYCHNGAGSANLRAVGGGNNWLIGPYQGQHSFYGGSGFVANTDAPVTQFEFVYATARQSLTNGVAKFWVNAVDKTDTAANSTTGPGTNFGCVNNPVSESLDGDIAELIAYDRELTDGEVDDIHAYLAARYGL